MRHKARNKEKDEDKKTWQILKSKLHLFGQRRLDKCRVVSGGKKTMKQKKTYHEHEFFE